MSRIVSFNFFYKSQVCQLFVRGPQDFIKSSQKFIQPLYSEIITRFRQTFPEIQSFELTSGIEDQLSKVLSILNESLGKVKYFKKRCKANVLSFYRYEDSLLKLSGGINEITHYFFPTKEVGVELSKKSANPYKILLDWARKETLEIESFIETIERKYYFDSIVAKNQTRLEKQQQGLENFQSGKKTLLQRLTKKNNEQKTKELEEEIGNTDKELQALREVIRYATGRLFQYQLPLFQEKEVAKLESTIRCYSGLVVEEYNDFITHFTNIQESIIPSII